MEMLFVRKSIKVRANRQSNKDAEHKAASLAQAAAIEHRREKCEVCFGNFLSTHTLCKIRQSCARPAPKLISAAFLTPDLFFRGEQELTQGSEIRGAGLQIEAVKTVIGIVFAPEMLRLIF